MSNPSNIEARLLDYLQCQHPMCGSVDATTDLIDSGQLDSLALMDLVVFMQSNFQIPIAPQDITPSNFRSIAVMAAWIESRLPSVRKAA